MAFVWGTKILLILFMQWITQGRSSSYGPEDYCLLDVYEPRCSQDEVIIIEKAFYGRMALGKCITQNVGPMKCYADAQRQLDVICSGRRTCSVSAIHRTLVKTNPCQTTVFSSYMTVSHSCLKVLNEESKCASKEMKLNSETGYLSPMNNPCTIHITVPHGNINFTLFSFIQSDQSKACYEIGTIKAQNDQKTLHICPTDQRIKPIYVTPGSSATVRLTSTANFDSMGSFLLHFQAIGCPIPPVPENAHAIREGDTATIVCNNSDTTWTTTCKDNKWTEQDRECPKRWSLTEIVKTSKEFPYGIFLTSIIGVSLGVLIGGFLLFLAINAFHRYQRRGKQYGPPPVIPDPDYKIYDTARMDLPFVPGLGHSTLPRHQMAAADAPPAPPPLSEATLKRLSRHTYERPNFPPP